MLDFTWWRSSGCEMVKAEPWSREIVHAPFMEYTETTHLQHASKEYDIIMLKVPGIASRGILFNMLLGLGACLGTPWRPS